MTYKTVSGARSAEIELNGSVYTVNFGLSCKYYAVRNDGSKTIYVSTTDKNCTPKNDDVVSIPSGGSYVHCNGFGGNFEIYLNEQKEYRVVYLLRFKQGIAMCV